MRYLGLDLGTKTLGVCISDKTNSIASFLKVIRFPKEDYQRLLPQIQEIVEKEKITDIALGLPKNMDNSCGFAAKRSFAFQELLEKNLNVKVHLVDERLTTLEAENILIEMDYSRKKRKRKIDGYAACLILETFIKGRDKNGSK